MRTLIIFIILGFLFLATLNSGCNQLMNTLSDSIYMDYDHGRVPYQLYEPDDIYPLHNDLIEISGLSFISDGTLAAIEDERGFLYILDHDDGSILRKIKFGEPGDYEGVQMVLDQVYVIKSSGDIFSFQLSDQEEVVAEKLKTGLSRKNDVEGLGFDGTYLLIACKASGDIENNKVEGKAIYRYDLEKKELIKKNILDIKKRDLNNFVKGRNFFNRVHDFNPSAIAVHPLSSDVYVLSADQILVVYDGNYKLKEVVRLDGAIYRQPEGICFALDGTLYLSSEGNGVAKGKLFRLRLLTEED